MHPIVIKHFSEISAAEYHRIVQAREAVFFLEQHITEPDADEVDPQSVFLWTEEDGRVVAFLRIIPAGIVCAEASVGRVLVDARLPPPRVVPPPDARSPAAYRPDVGSAARPHLGARSTSSDFTHRWASKPFPGPTSKPASRMSVC